MGLWLTTLLPDVRNLIPTWNVRGEARGLSLSLSFALTLPPSRSLPLPPSPSPLPLPSDALSPLSLC